MSSPALNRGVDRVKLVDPDLRHVTSLISLAASHPLPCLTLLLSKLQHLASLHQLATKFNPCRISPFLFSPYHDFQPPLVIRHRLPQPWLPLPSTSLPSRRPSRKRILPPRSSPSRRRASRTTSSLRAMDGGARCKIPAARPSLSIMVSILREGVRRARS